LTLQAGLFWGYFADVLSAAAATDDDRYKNNDPAIVAVISEKLVKASHQASSLPICIICFFVKLCYKTVLCSFFCFLIR